VVVVLLLMMMCCMLMHGRWVLLLPVLVGGQLGHSCISSVQVARHEQHLPAEQQHSDRNGSQVRAKLVHSCIVNRGIKDDLQGEDWM
jgi:hypothetical protein